MKLANKYLVAFSVLFVLLGSLVFAGLTHTAYAATTPAQCVINTNVLGGASVPVQVNCSTLPPGGTYVDGHCYFAEGAREVDCAAAPFLGQWSLKCDGVVGDITTDIASDPATVCAEHNGTYAAASSGTTTPTTPTGTLPPSQANPTAPSGSGAATGAEKTQFPAGTDNAYKRVANDGKYVCGSNSPNGGTQVKTSINLGCAGKDPAILDLLFAIIRLLSTGVGIVIVASMVVAGIQYTASRGNPQEVEKAQERIRSNIIAFAIFIFSYAILNWLVPAGLLK